MRPGYEGSSSLAPGSTCTGNKTAWFGINQTAWSVLCTPSSFLLHPPVLLPCWARLESPGRSIGSPREQNQCALPSPTIPGYLDTEHATCSFFTRHIQCGSLIATVRDCLVSLLVSMRSELAPPYQRTPTIHSEVVPGIW